MTGGNEIEFVTRLVPAGDEQAVLQRIAEEGYQGLVQFFRDKKIPLPSLDAATMERNVDEIADLLAARLTEAGRLAGTSLRDTLQTALRDVNLSEIRNLVVQLGGAKEAADALGVSLRTVQRWTTNAGQTRNASENQVGALRQAVTEREAAVEAERLAAAERQAAAAAAEQTAASEALNARLQAMSNEARAVEVAQLRLDAVMHDTSSTFEQRSRAITQYNSAMSAMEKAESKAAETQSRPGFAASFVGGFTTGSGLFHQAGDANGPNAFVRIGGETGEFLGAIARYQAAYAAIFALTRGFHALVDAESAAQDATIELGHATDLTGDQLGQFGSQLAQVVSAAGGTAAAAIETATRGIFAFGDNLPRTPEGELTPQGQAQAQDIGTLSARAAAMTGLLTGSKDLNATQQQLIASTLAFNLGVGDQERVLNAAANAARNFGADIGGLIQGLPQVAQVAQQAGLSVEQTTNILAAAARGGQTGTTAATSLDRALLAIDNPQTRVQLQGMGVDTQGQSGQVLESLAARWSHLSDAQKEQAEAALGGVRAIRTLLPVLDAGQHLLDANNNSYERGGYATELYYARLNTLSGMLRTVGGDAQHLAYDIGQTGALDIFGAMLKGAAPLITTIDDIVRVFDDVLPGAVRGWVTSLGLVLLAVTAIGRQMARNEAIQVSQNALTGTQAAEEGVVGAERLTGAAGLFSRIRGRGGFAVGATDELGYDASLGYGASTVARSEVGVLAGARAGFGALGGALLGPLGAVAGVIALGVAADSAYHAIQNENKARQQAADAEKSLKGATSPEALRGSAGQIGDAIAELKHAQSGIIGGLLNDNDAQIARLKTLQTYALHMADAIESQQRALAGHATLGAFFSNSGDITTTIAGGITAMQQAGVPAVRQFQLLTQAIERSAQAAGTWTGPDLPNKVPLRRPGAYGTEEFVAAAVNAATTALSNRLKSVGPEDFKTVHDAVYGGPQPPPGTDQRTIDVVRRARRNAVETPQGLADQLGEIGVLQDPNALRVVLEAAMKKEHVGAGTLLTPDLQKKLADDVIDSLGVSKQFIGKARKDLEAAITNALTGAASTQANEPIPALRSQNQFNTLVLGQTNKDGTPKAGTSLQDLLTTNAAFDDPRAIDPALSRLQSQTGYLQVLAEQAKAQGLGGAALQVLLQLLHQSQHDLAVAAVAHIDRIRKAAEANTTDPTKLAAQELKYVTQEVHAALKQGDMGELIAVLATADKATQDSIRKSLETALKSAQLVYDVAMKEYNTAMAAFRALPAGLKNTNPDLVPTLPSDADVKTAKRNVNSFKDAASQSTPSDAGGSTKDDPTAARILSEAISGDPVSEARKQLQAARYTLSKAKPNTTEYYNDLKAVHDDELNLAQTIAARTAAVEQASARPGNQLSAANAALGAAKTNLDAQVRGTAAWWAAWQQYQEAQYSASQAAQEHAHQVRLAHLDQTDPVATAREDLHVANARLNADQRNGTGDVAADKAARDSAAARLQGARFDQRFHDVQVAHDLGQMSDAAYLKYLDSQRDRLQAIHHKTRQQIEELQQIDQAIKGAADAMQGQWNIGDIRIPTAYEARRYIQASGQGQGYNSTNITHTDNRRFDFKGLDKPEIMAILSQLLGADATGTTGTQPRKK